MGKVIAKSVPNDKLHFGLAFLLSTQQSQNDMKGRK
jgi:hypothetical protein